MASLEDEDLQAPSSKTLTRFLAGDFTPTIAVGTPDPSHASIVMCLFNRPGRIREVLNTLARQRGTRGIDIYLWNNCPDDHAIYEEAIREQDLGGALKSIQLVKSPVNLGSMSRFFFARKLAVQGFAGPVIVLDDDEVVTPWFVRKALKRYDPKAITAWWAFQVNGPYWDRKPAGRRDKVDHIGPGGSVMDSRIFLDDAFFTDIPDKYWMLDDVWITYYARQRGIQLRKLDVRISFVLEETNHYHTVVNLKDEFFSELYSK